MWGCRTVDNTISVASTHMPVGGIVCTYIAWAYAKYTVIFFLQHFICSKTDYVANEYDLVGLYSPNFNIIGKQFLLKWNEMYIKYTTSALWSRHQTSTQPTTYLSMLLLMQNGCVQYQCATKRMTPVSFWHHLVIFLHKSFKRVVRLAIDGLCSVCTVADCCWQCGFYW